MSKREEVLQALFQKLSSLTGVIVKRNEMLPQKIPREGIVILRDGNVGEPEVLLSPACYIFTHQAEVEVLVQREFTSDANLDEILEQIGHLIKQDPTLNGQVDYMHADPPEFIEHPIDGGITIRAAVVPIVLEYLSETPLI